MLKGLSNYRAGGKFLLTVRDRIQYVTVLDNDKIKLHLKLEDDTDKWFQMSELGKVEKGYRKKFFSDLRKRQTIAVYKEPNNQPPPVIISPEPAAKTNPKTVCDKVAKPEILQEKVDDMTYAFQGFRFELRMILKRHGVITDPKWSHKKILDAVDKALI